MKMTVVALSVPDKFGEGDGTAIITRCVWQSILLRVVKVPLLTATSFFINETRVILLGDVAFVTTDFVYLPIVARLAVVFGASSRPQKQFALKAAVEVFHEFEPVAEQEVEEAVHFDQIRGVWNLVSTQPVDLSTRSWKDWGRVDNHVGVDGRDTLAERTVGEVSQKNDTVEAAVTCFEKRAKVQRQLCRVSCSVSRSVSCSSREANGDDGTVADRSTTTVIEGARPIVGNVEEVVQRGYQAVKLGEVDSRIVEGEIDGQSPIQSESTLVDGVGRSYLFGKLLQQSSEC